VAIGLWGGEPFLRADLDDICREVFAQGLDVSTVTNCFWGNRPENAVARFGRLLAMKPRERTLKLSESCDILHLENPATPLENVANVVRAGVALNDRTFPLVVEGLQVEGDLSLQALFQLLGPSYCWVSDDAVVGDRGGVVIPASPNAVLHVSSGPVNLAVGRAKTSFRYKRSSAPLVLASLKNSRAPLLHNHSINIGVSGASFLDQELVGEEAFPFGNIHEVTLRRALADILVDPFATLLTSNPARLALAPFRKYVDLARLFAVSHSYPELFMRLYQMDRPDHDFSSQLDDARKTVSSPSASPAKSLAAIDQLIRLGDITDVAALERLMANPRLSRKVGRAAAIAFMALDNEDVWAKRLLQYSFIHSSKLCFEGIERAAHLGVFPLPDWFEACAFVLP